jgi:repressor LexA
MGRTLTSRQQRVYDFIHDQISNRGYGPTVREIGEFVGIKSPNGVICHLRALERKGMITRAANKSRAIELKNRPKADRSPGLPMRGRVDHGYCNLFDAPQTLDVLNALQHPERFLLQYNGDDLRDWAIADGDILVIEQGAGSLAGSIELVRHASGSMVLRPAEGSASDEAERIVVVETPADALSALGVASKSSNGRCEVVGVVVGIIRTLPTMRKATVQQIDGAPANCALVAHAPHALGRLHVAAPS